MTRHSFLSLFFILIILPACAKKQHLPPSLPPQSSPQQHSTRDRLNQTYREWAGVPHRDGGLSKNGIDCSGFVHLVFKNTFYKTVPRTTTDLAVTGKSIPQNRLQPGDIVFFKIRRNVKHVGIYIGKNQFIHTSKSRGVWRSNLDLKYWQDHYWQSRRILP